MNFGFSCTDCCELIPQLYGMGLKAARALGERFLFGEPIEDQLAKNMPLPGSPEPLVTSQGDWVQVSTSGYSTYAISSDGSLWSNSAIFEVINEMRMFDAGPWEMIDHISGPNPVTLGIKQDGTLWQWDHSTLAGREFAPRIVLEPQGIERVDISTEWWGDKKGGKYSLPPSVSITMESDSPPLPESFEPSRLASATPRMEYFATEATVTSGGSGYHSPPPITITDGNTSAPASEVVMDYHVSDVALGSGGAGYLTPPTVTVVHSEDDDPPSARAVVEVSKMGCVVTGVDVTSGGGGYSSPPDVLVNGVVDRRFTTRVVGGSVTAVDFEWPTKIDEPSVSISLSGGGGSGAVALARSRLNHVVTISLVSGGSGYRSVPRVVFSGGGGGGAEAAVHVSGSVERVVCNSSVAYASSPTATVGSGDAVVSVVSYGAVAEVILDDPGLGYSSGVTGKDVTPTPGGSVAMSYFRFKPKVSFTRQAGDAYSDSDAGSTAEATASLTAAPIKTIEIMFFADPDYDHAGKAGRVFVVGQSHRKWEDGQDFASGFDIVAEVTVTASPAAYSVNIIKRGADMKVQPFAAWHPVEIFPVQPLPGTTWRSASAGEYFSLAIGSDGYPYWWDVYRRLPVSSPTRYGATVFIKNLTILSYNPSIAIPPPPWATGLPNPDSWAASAMLNQIDRGASPYLSAFVGKTAKCIPTSKSWGYISAPTVAFSGCTGTVELHGPGPCKSVVAAGPHAYAIEENGTLWKLNCNVSTFGDWTASFIALGSRRFWFPASGAIFVESGGAGYSGQYATVFYDEVTTRAIVPTARQYPLLKWCGSAMGLGTALYKHCLPVGILNNCEIDVPSTFPSPTMTASSGSGAALTRSPMRIRHLGTGPGKVGLGKTWRAVTKDGYGMLENGDLFFLTGEIGEYPEYPGAPMPNSQQRPYAMIRDSLGVMPDQTLRRIGRPFVSTEKIIGDVELIIDDPGGGYTEPAMLAFSSQPPRTAVVGSSLNAGLWAVGVLRGGSGFNTAPTISVSGGGGSGGTARAVIAGGLHSVTVSSAGSGYRLPPKVSFSQPGISASATCLLNENGGVSSVQITSGGRYRAAPDVIFTPVPDIGSVSVTSGGSGYSSPPGVVIVGGGGDGAAAESVIDGRVTSVFLSGGGSGYTSPPTVTFVSSDGGSGASASANIDQSTGRVVSVTLTSPGGMYQSAPQVFISGGGGRGATCYATIAGAVHSVRLISRGGGYYGQPEVFFQGGGGSGASATAATEMAGAGAAGVCRINGSVLYCTVESRGASYSSRPDVSASMAGNIAIEEADMLLASGEIDQEEHSRIVEEATPEFQSRIAGPPAFSIASGGDGYDDPSQVDWSPYQSLGEEQGRRKAVEDKGLVPSNFYLLGPHKTSGAGYEVSLPSSNASGKPYTAPVSSGKISSIPQPSGGTDWNGYCQPPQVVFENTSVVRSKMSVRRRGYAIPGSRHYETRQYGAGSALQLTYEWWEYAGIWGDTVAAYTGNSVEFGWYGGGEVPDTLTKNQFPDAFFFDVVRRHYRGCVLFQDEDDSFWSDGWGFEDVSFSAPPAISVESDTGSGAVVEVTIDSGGLPHISLQSGGSDYGPFTRLVASGGVVQVNAAVANAIVEGGRVVAIELTHAGSGYMVPPTVIIHGGGGVGAFATAKTNGSAAKPGGLTSIVLESAGSGYTSTPLVSIVSANPFFCDAVPLPAKLPRLRPSGAGNVLEVECIEPDPGQSDLRFSTSDFMMNDGGPTVIFDDGYVESVQLGMHTLQNTEHSLNELLPSGTSVTVAGYCESTASISVVRPKWANDASGLYWNHPHVWGAGRNGAFVGIRDTTQP